LDYIIHTFSDLSDRNSIKQNTHDKLWNYGSNYGTMVNIIFVRLI